MNDRNQAIDLLRAIGAFAVICLHMRYIGISDTVINAMSLFSRWAVPFFFLVSGFFFEKKSRSSLNDEFLKTFKNLLGIFIVSNIIYFFLAIKTEYYTLGDILSLRTILLGDYIHLWFIGAMIFSYILLWFILSNGLIKCLLPISISILVFSLIADPYSVFFDIHVEGPFSRFLLAVPFLFIGFIYSKNNLNIFFNATTGLLISLLGFSLQFAESYLIFFYRKKSLFNHEFLLGTFILSIGVFILSQNIKINNNNYISKIGRQYSLLIYIYHPMVILIVFFIIKHIGLSGPKYLLWFNPITVFICTLLVLKMIEKKIPLLSKFISGKA